MSGIRTRTFPTRAPINANIELYAAAMAEVAKANGVQFVDLLCSLAAAVCRSRRQGQSLTINGIHSHAEGDRLLAPIMYRGAVWRAAPPRRRSRKAAPAAIIDKNEQWHARYRTVDGYNVYGGRSQMAFPDEPRRPEDHQLQGDAGGDVAARRADRQPRQAHLVGRGGKAMLRSMTPSFRRSRRWPPTTPAPIRTVVAVPQRRRSDREDDASPQGCKVNLFASEEQFPELVKPVQMAWDTKGRLWVSVWPNYPERTPDLKDGDSILIFEDTKGTGKADKCTHFIDGLNCPTGFQFYKDGILLMQAPDLWYVRRSTDGSGKANAMERVLMGMDSADSITPPTQWCSIPAGRLISATASSTARRLKPPKDRSATRTAASTASSRDTGRFERYAALRFCQPARPRV